MRGDIEPVLPLNKGHLLPKNKLDKGLFVLMSVGIPSITLWELRILFRYHSEIDSNCLLHILLQIFLFINVMGNLYYLQRVSSSGKNKSFPSALLVSWKYCHFCEMNSPPRSHHCPICDECILKRDQHCMFAGSCVGFYNHRFYLVAVTYIMIGSLYASIFQWPHCLESIGGFHLLPLVSMIAPHIAVVLGVISPYGFICALSQIILTLVAALTTYLFAVQIICIAKGQTIHEKKSGITFYDLGWKENLLLVLGERWYLALICPFFSSPLKGDGVYFQTFYDLKEIKNV